MGDRARGLYPISIPAVVVEPEWNGHGHRHGGGCHTMKAKYRPNMIRFFDVSMVKYTSYTEKKY